MPNAQAPESCSATFLPRTLLVTRSHKDSNNSLFALGNLPGLNCIAENWNTVSDPSSAVNVMGFVLVSLRIQPEGILIFSIKSLSALKTGSLDRSAFSICRKDSHCLMRHESNKLLPVPELPDISA